MTWNLTDNTLIIYLNLVTFFLKFLNLWVPCTCIIPSFQYCISVCCEHQARMFGIKIFIALRLDICKILTVAKF